MNKLYKTKLYSYCFLIFLCIFYAGYSPSIAPFIPFQYSLSSPPTITFKPSALPKQIPDTLAPSVSASSYLVMDADSFTPLLAFNEHELLYPASTVKLATALVAFRDYVLTQPLVVKTTISEEITMGLVPDEKITVLNLLYGTLVNSSNDAAYTLAENYSGGVEQFVTAMNNLANQLHMKSTHFIDPIGFDNPKQKTTAYDLSLLANEFIRYPLLLDITSTKSVTVSDVSFQYFHYLLNGNQLIGVIPHVGGLKTGTTDLAGENLISYYIYKGHPIIIVVLKSEDRFADTKALISNLNATFSYQNIDSAPAN